MIKDFIIQNWQWLACILISFISCIVHLIQKRPVARSLAEQVQWIISNLIPGFIVEAEKTAKPGEQKLDYVINRAIASLQAYMLCDEKELQTARVLFANGIERILATPRKKV